MADKLNKLSEAQISSLTKSELSGLLNGVLREILTNTDETYKISRELSNKVDIVTADLSIVKHDVQNLRSEMNDVQTRVTSLEHTVDPMQEIPDKVANLERSLADMFKAMEFQQRFLEGTDARLRGRNLIFLGVSESNTVMGDSDADRVKTIIQKTGFTEDLGEVSVKRLGTSGGARARPLHVTVTSHDIQYKILTKASSLKNIDGYKEIFIRRDTHPTIRKEINRLLQREKDEKDSASNAGCEINYDRKERVLRRDGEVIDKFRPSF